MKYYLSIIIFALLSTNSFCQQERKKDEKIDYREDLEFKVKGSDDSLKFVAISKSLAPIEIIVSDKRTNQELRSVPVQAGKNEVILENQAGQSDSIFRKKIRDSLRIGYYLGHESLIDPDLDFPYRLPFQKGKKYEVSQSFNGNSTHNSERSRFAIDFKLEVGEPVHAARGGLVVKVIDWFTKQGGKELINAANKIVILHDDGTLASYMHLEYKGSFVKEGDRVKKGEKIGKVGLTGFTRGPHLHFVVRKERDIAIPVYFEGYPNEQLGQGKRYKVRD